MTTGTVPPFGEPITTEQAVTYTPWTDGYAVGFKCEFAGHVEYIYFNPSSDLYGPTTEPKPPGELFVYRGPAGDPNDDESQHFYQVFTNVPVRARIDCGCVPHKTRMTGMGFTCDTEGQGYCNFECPHQDDEEND